MYRGLLHFAAEGSACIFPLRRRRLFKSGCLLFFSIVISTIGCRKEAAGEPVPGDSVGRINRWVLDSLRRYYYWSADIPANYDYRLPTDQFFTALLSPADRFSWISDGAAIPPPSNSYFVYGFHYAWVAQPGRDELIGVVTLVNKGGAADAAGWERGTCFTAVNGKPVTLSNMAEINRQLQKGPVINLTPARWQGSDWELLPLLTLQARFAGENPVQWTRTFTAGGLSTGYLFYQSFDERYDAELLLAIAKLKQAGVRELILDLRYNAGGSVASSAKLAAMLTSRLTPQETWAIYEGNQWEGKKPRSLQAVLNTSTSGAGKTYAELQTRCLSLERIFVLTTNGTVSAAELLINNLRPFIPVIQIGRATAGKDEASFLIRDERNPRQVTWTMQPTIYKLFNKAGQGGYAAGLRPTHDLEEMATLPLAGIGEPEDPLVQKALQLIYGGSVPPEYTTLRIPLRPLAVKPLYHSAAEKTGQKPILLNNRE
jgi:carboxyl-terminal processing protease